MIQRKPLSAEAAMVRCEELCARAEHSSGEIAEKLYRWGISETDRDRIIDSLIDRRFIDDSRYARAFVRDKVEFAGWGRRKIAAALYQKRVERAIIAEALNDIEMGTYKARLRALLSAKRRSIPDADTYEGRTRLFRFAASRGFEPDLVASEIRSLYQA